MVDREGRRTFEFHLPQIGIAVGGEGVGDVERTGRGLHFDGGRREAGAGAGAAAEESAHCDDGGGRRGRLVGGGRGENVTREGTQGVDEDGE
jgi:hypothetical protein